MTLIKLLKEAWEFLQDFALCIVLALDEDDGYGPERDAGNDPDDIRKAGGF